MTEHVFRYTNLPSIEHSLKVFTYSHYHHKHETMSEAHGLLCESFSTVHIASSEFENPSFDLAYGQDKTWLA